MRKIGKVHRIDVTETTELHDLQRDTLLYEQILHDAKSITWPIISGRSSGCRLHSMTEQVIDKIYVLHLRLMVIPSSDYRGPISNRLVRQVHRHVGCMDVIYTKPIAGE